ncbi:MAG TPA: hypothetical protein VMG11_02240 [Steroidobacteraceae bacterium]|nr:hypothetical protein [Steroidobacteraceae bacterium]
MDGIDLPCEPPSKPVIERLDEPIPDAGECCVYLGKPHIVFRDWDYAEDWSGEFVRVVDPKTLAGAARLSTVAFWSAVRGAHGSAAS